MLPEAGIEAEALHAADVAPCGQAIDPADGVIALGHTGEPYRPQTNDKAERFIRTVLGEQPELLVIRRQRLMR